MSDVLSSTMDDDAAAAYQRLRRQALALRAVSRPFDVLAARLITAYRDALTTGEPAAWSMFVRKTAMLVGQAAALRGLVKLDADEREALAFFQAIIDENVDLLLPLAVVPSGIPPSVAAVVTR